MACKRHVQSCDAAQVASTMNGQGAGYVWRSVRGLPALLTITLHRYPSSPGRHRRMLRLLPEAQPLGRKRTLRRPVALLSRSEAPTSELQSLMRTSYAAFCLNTQN